MNPYVLTEEQESFRASLRRLFATKSTEEDVRALLDDDDGYDREVWRQLSEQLGLQGLCIPEAYGGSGFGQMEMAIALEEMGRVLYAGPFFATVVLAANTLLQSGDTAAMERYLPRIAAGELTATVAFSEPGDGRDLEATTARATAADDRYRLDGVKSFVPEGMAAELVLVLARADEGVSLFAVDLGAGVRRTPLTTLDLTRRQAHLELIDAPAELIGVPGQGIDIMRRVTALAAVSLAAEQVGGAQRCLEMAVEYARDRVQFGRPIGSFQAIKHVCAKMSVQLEGARTAMLYASWCADANADELREEASVAQAACSDAFFSLAADNLQVHGGIGFTWEHSAHLYLRRAKASELFLGDSRHHRELLATCLAI